MCIRDSTWTTRTIEEKDKQGNVHYITKLADAYKVSGDAFYMQNGKAVLPLGTLTVEEVKSPSGYLLEGAYMQANGSSEQIKGCLLYTSLDALNFHEIVGTIAGDDTIMCAVRSVEENIRLMDRLRKMVGK